MIPIFSRAGLTLALLLLCLGLTRPATAGSRPVSFHLGAQCLCAQCAFDAQRALKKLDGVQGVTLNIKERRIDIALDESKRPVSALAAFLAKLDLGAESALIWPVGRTADAEQCAKALAQVPGVKSARADTKARAVLLTFAPAPTVTTAQLDGAIGGPAHA